MRIIKKYSNRRLYDTGTSSYVNLEDLAALVQGGEEVQVVDARTGDDLTRGVLLQVILEVRGGIDLLPLGLLHRIIRYGGDHPGQQLAMRQLAAGLELLDRQVTTVERQFGFWKNDAPPPAEPDPEPEPDHGPEPTVADEGEMDDLRRRLAELEERLKG